MKQLSFILLRWAQKLLFSSLFYFSQFLSVLYMDCMPQASPVTLNNQFRAKVVCIVMHDLARLMSSAPILKLLNQITLLPMDWFPLLFLACLSPLLLALSDCSVICYFFLSLNLASVFLILSPSLPFSVLCLFTMYCQTETWVFSKNFKDEVNRACWSCVLEGKTCQCIHYTTFIL